MPRKPTVWSVGYEGHTRETFVALLQAHRIEAVADVRERPWSRKRGFSKSALEATLLASGIRYVHLKALGAPSSLRKEYHATGDVEGFHAGYRTHLERQRGALEQLETLARGGRVAMMCLEADMATCHRSVIADQLAADGYAVESLP